MPHLNLISVKMSAFVTKACAEADFLPSATEHLATEQ